MSSFSKSLLVSTPADSDLVSDGAGVIRDFKTAVQERMKLEHYDMVAAGSSSTASDTVEAANASGRHIPGRVSAVYIGTTAQIASLDLLTGRIAYDTDLNQLKICNGSNWTTYAVGFNDCAFLGYANAAQTYVTVSTNQKVYFHAEEFDYGSAFVPGSSGVTQSRFTVPVTGIYMLGTTVGFTSGQSITTKVQSMIYKNPTYSGIVVATGTTVAVGMVDMDESTNASYASCQTIVSATAGDYFDVVMRYEGGSSKAFSTSRESMQFWGYRIR